jgi:polyribonucleotide nucleotidyltransferase
MDEIRDLSAEIDFLPRTHGSAIFTRGETQALATTTLGAIGEHQILDGLGLEDAKRFMLHYNFPQFSDHRVLFYDQLLIFLLHLLHKI